MVSNRMTQEDYKILPDGKSFFEELDARRGHEIQSYCATPPSKCLVGFVDKTTDETIVVRVSSLVNYLRRRRSQA